MEEKRLYVDIEFIDTDSTGGNSDIKTVSVCANNRNIKEITVYVERAYIIYDNLYRVLSNDVNAGYEDFVKEYGKNPTDIKAVYQKLTSTIEIGKWNVIAFVDILNIIYPELKAEVIAKETKFTFHW